jgi:hypothetical protein
MNVYMLEDIKSGLFYRRLGSEWSCWVEQKEASIWTSRRGPAQALTVAHRFKNRTPIIQTFRLEKIDV